MTQYWQRHSLLLDMFMASDLIRTFGSMKAEPEIISIRFYLLSVISVITMEGVHLCTNDSITQNIQCRKVERM